METNTTASKDTKLVKETRAEIQKVVDNIKGFHFGSRELSLTITKLEEAKMWLGKHLGNIPGNVDLKAERDSKELSA